MKMKIQKKADWKAIVLVMEALVILYSILIFVRPNQTYYFEGSSLISKYGIFVEDFMDLYGDGYYLDSNLHADAEDLSEGQNELDFMTVESPEVDLKRGSYKVTIDYLVGDGEETYTASSDYNTWPVIIQRTNVKLPEDQTEVTYELRSSIGVTGYKVTANFKDAIFLFVHSIKIEETNDWKNVNLGIVLFVILLLNLGYVFYKRVPEEEKRSFRIYLGIFGVLLFFSSLPVFSVYLKDGYDLLFHLNRIEGIKNALLDGQFPVRLPYSWMNGYGYAVSIFYGDSLLYFPAVLRILGFTVQGAYKAYVLTINFATIAVSYWCFYKIIRNRKIALAGCVVYVLAPYRLLCIYLRGAVGEYTAMLFLPLVLYGLYVIYAENDKRAKWLPLAIGFAGLVQCHIISTLLTALFAALFCFANLKKTVRWKNFKQLLIAVCAVVVADFWFIVPFLDYFQFEYRSTELNLLGKMNAHGTFLSQLFALFPRGTGDAYTIDGGIGQTGEMSYPLGAAFGMVAVCYFLYLLGREKDKKREPDKLIKLGNYALVGGILATIMTCVWFPWDFIQQAFDGKLALIVQNIQFPWRILGIASLLFSTAFICLLGSLKSTGYRKEAVVLTGLVVVLTSISACYFYSDNEDRREPLYIQSETDIHSEVGEGIEYLLKGTDIGSWLNDEVIMDEPIENFAYEKVKGSSFITYKNSTDSEVYADIPVFCYKGYQAKDIDTGETIEIMSGEQNRIRVVIPSGYEGTIKVRFQEPLYWRISEVVSIIGILGGIYILLKTKRNVE